MEGYRLSEKKEREIAREVREIISEMTSKKSSRPAKELLERICWLLGLSKEERAFITHLAANPGDRSMISVFADWLEERSQYQDGIRLRRLIPGKGEILLVGYNVMPREDKKDVMVFAESIRKELLALGNEVVVVCVPFGLNDNLPMRLVPAEEIRKAGWVRADEIRI